MGHVRKVPSKRQAVVDDDTKLNLLLALEENPITPARQLARDSNLNHKTVLKILKYEKKRTYKMQAVQELLEDDPDRRVEFCDLLMTCIDQNQLSLEWIVFSDEATFTINGAHLFLNSGCDADVLQMSIYRAVSGEPSHENSKILTTKS
ncbi:hypothetical protein NQ318_013380 [Aromia moschata]|uniref:Transposase n=1 Tax=Aromia moschata TaxID=1265417 RepID=A0AAV8X8F7_9CUCU|nr:hypothetical protein NQ318_013380 [Aromia moschata]